MDSIKSFFSKTIATIEVLHQSEDSYVHVLSLFEWKSKQLRLLSHCRGNSVSELKIALEKIDHSIWIINDDSVVNKVLPSDSKSSGLSHMKWNSFYASSGKSTLSLCRISDFLKHQNKIQNIKNKVCFFFIGLRPIESVLELLPAQFEFNRHAIVHEKGEVLSIDSKTDFSDSKPLVLNGDAYPSESILGFAAAVTFLKEYSLSMRSIVKLPRLEPERSTNDVERSQIGFLNINSAVFRSFLNQMFFKYLIRVHGVFIGIVLIFGMGIQTYRQHILEDNRSLQTEAEAINQSNLKIIESISAKKVLYERMNQNNQHNVAVLIDSLLLKIPSSISLNKLLYQPQKRQSAEFNKENLFRNQFFIQGSLGEKKAFSEWKAQLEALPWVEQINALQLSRIKGKPLQFEFVIELNNE